MPNNRAIYQEHPPCISLQKWVAYYWQYRAPKNSKATSHPIPPEAGITVTLLPPTPGQRSPDQVSSITSGPQRTSVDVPAHPGDVVCGIRFWPGTGPAYLDPTPEDLVDRMEPTRIAAPQMDEALTPVKVALTTDSLELPYLARLLDQALEGLQLRPAALDLPMLRAVFQCMSLGQGASNSQLYEQAGLSPRQFRRRFKTAVGLSTTEFRRLQRIRATLMHAVLETSASWIDLAAENGYADQAHLCREFQRGAGRSPRVYRRAVEHIDHAFVVR